MSEFQFPSDIKYTKNELKIINYIYENPAVFIHISIGELSKRLGVSESTISRFARHTGYSDFKALRSSLFSYIQENHSPAEKLKYTMTDTFPASSLASVFAHQQSCMDKTLDLLDLNQLNLAIEAILSAQTLYVYAKGASLCLAQLLKFRLLRFGLKVEILASSGSELFETMNFITKEDTVLLFGFQKTPKEACVLLDYQKKVAYKTILISSRLYDLQMQTADISLYTYRGEPNEYHSMAVPMALINAIVLQVALRLGDCATQNLKALHELKEFYKEDIPR